MKNLTSSGTGLAIGVALDQLAIGIALGAAFGLLLGPAFESKAKTDGGKKPD